ncbi:MAG: glycosyltransferase [Chloroflexi bacterium]|nr:glycosyltransferase [Chloroflexota bacterium]
MEPLVSVIVPSYNQAQYIGATLDSILQQNYAHLECLVMDGGSKDQTVEVLQTYTDPRLTWVSERDKGQPDAINKGLQRSSGEIITYLNSDDLLAPGTIAFAVDYFAAHPTVDLLYGDGSFVDAHGKRLSPFKGAPFDLELCVLNGQDLAQPGTFWKRTVTDKIGLFDLGFHYRLDFDYWIRAALAGFHLEYVPGERAAYRLHGESKTISQRAAFVNDWEVILARLYEKPDLPDNLVSLKGEAFNVLDWWKTKNLWLDKKYDEARPKLRHFLHDHKTGRKVLAATMLFDSYFQTPVTKMLTSSLRRTTGTEIFR